MSPKIQKAHGPAVLPPSPERIIKAHPVPTLKTFQPHIEHRKIEVPDFALPGDEISLKKKRQFESQIDEEAAEAIQSRNFEAQPLPVIRVVVSKLSMSRRNVTLKSPNQFLSVWKLVCVARCIKQRLLRN
jgi:hypothetical protein